MNNYALIESSKVINIVVWDGEAEVDFGVGVTAVEIPEADPVSIGWTYTDGSFSAPELTEEEIKENNNLAIQQNLAMKEALMAAASQQISILQDAVDLEMATDEETSALLLWKKYRVLLSRIDANTTDEISWPEEP